MDPKRKKIYIIIIVVCVVLAAGILYWGYSSSPTASNPTDTPLSATPATAIVPEATGGSVQPQALDGGYTAPKVFPIVTKFDASVLDSSAFKTLYPYLPVTLGVGELGRDDPFKAY